MGAATGSGAPVFYESITRDRVFHADFNFKGPHESHSAPLPPCELLVAELPLVRSAELQRCAATTAVYIIGVAAASFLILMGKGHS